MKKKIFGLHPNIFFLGMVSLLTDVSSEMIFTLMPLFLANVLGTPTVLIGLIEGIAESTASLMKVASGWISDKFGKRKILAVSGYGFSTLFKPLMFFAGSWGLALGVRFADRLGKGIRNAPRDALVADSLEPYERGKGFGIHRTMDTAGAAIGLISAAIIIFLLQGGNLDMQLSTYQWLVIIGVIPAILALFMFFFIQERKKEQKALANQVQKDGQETGKVKISSSFYWLMLIIFIFTLGNSSDAFLVLRAQNLGNNVLNIVILLILFNISYAIIAIPAGIISDKLGRKGVIIVGWLLYFATYIGLAFSNSSWQIWPLFVCYGIYYGLTEGVVKAYIADLIPSERRGTAYGIYNGIIGITLLPASLIAGWLWQAFNPAATFYFGAGMALIATIGFILFSRKKVIS
jgi:MFS family permease